MSFTRFQIILPFTKLVRIQHYDALSKIFTSMFLIVRTCHYALCLVNTITYERLLMRFLNGYLLAY